MKKATEFNELVQDLLQHPLVQNMRNMKQHSNSVNLLEHCVYTAYITYIVCDFLNLNTKETTRAALLHDFRTEENPRMKCILSHSKKALLEANKYFNLTDFQKNIIVSHMWPLNPRLFPKSKEALIVNFADTYCATMEMLHVFRKTETAKELSNITFCT